MLGCGPSMTDKTARLRQQILDLSARYFAEAFPAAEFTPGETTVPVSGKVIDAGDLSSVVDSALDCWFTTGRFAQEFERKLARFVGVRCGLAGQLRLLRQPSRRQCPHLAQTRRPPASARR